MLQKTAFKEEGYSARDFEKIRKALKDLEEARQDPQFRKAVKEFIKETT